MVNFRLALASVAAGCPTVVFPPVVHLVSRSLSALGKTPGLQDSAFVTGNYRH
jgi:hypothetical protein